MCYNILPIAIELPVCKENPSVMTGHIDILAFCYFNNHLFFLILDLKPKGFSEILKAIPQLTIYGFLLREQINHWSNELDLAISNKDYSIISIGFNNEVALSFDPFIVYDYIFKFLEYEKGISGRTETISLDKQTMTKLVAFFKTI